MRKLSSTCHKHLPHPGQIIFIKHAPISDKDHFPDIITRLQLLQNADQVMTLESSTREHFVANQQILAGDQQSQQYLGLIDLVLIDLGLIDLVLIDLGLIDLVLIDLGLVEFTVLAVTILF